MIRNKLTDFYKLPKQINFFQGPIQTTLKVNLYLSCFSNGNIGVEKYRSIFICSQWCNLRRIWDLRVSCLLCSSEVYMFCTCFASFRTMISKSLKDTDITIVHAKWLQSYPIFCSLPGSSVHGILQARILEWVAMPNLRIKPTSSHLLYWQAGSLSLAPPRKPWYNYRFLGKRCFKLQTHRSKI